MTTQHPSRFSWDEVDLLDDLQRLKRVLEFLPDDGIIEGWRRGAVTRSGSSGHACLHGDKVSCSASVRKPGSNALSPFMASRRIERA